MKQREKKRRCKGQRRGNNKEKKGKKKVRNGGLFSI